MDRPMPHSPPEDPSGPAVYAWPNSAVAGETVTVYGRGPVGPARMEVARIGAHRINVHSESVTLSPHEFGPDADAFGCDWPSIATFEIGTGWWSGYYEIVLQIGADPDDVSGASGTEVVGYVVVRNSDSASAKPLLVLTTNTWNAYNDVEGTNIYNGGTHASFIRPISPGFLRKPDGPGSRVAVIGPPDLRMRTHVGHIRSNGLSAWSGSAGWPSWELSFVRWAEANNTELDYAVNADLEFLPDILDNRHLYLSACPTTSTGRGACATRSNGSSRVGAMRRSSAATCVSGRCGWSTTAGRWWASKQQFEHDPVYGTDRQDRLTSIWSDTLIGRPENSMNLTSFNRGGYHRIGKSIAAGAGAYTVHQPDHWLFENTGVGRGDLLGQASTVVGHECDGCELQLIDGVPVPIGNDGCPPGTIVLATAPASPFTRETAPHR